MCSSQRHLGQLYMHMSLNCIELTKISTASSHNIFGTRMRAQYHRNACPSILSINTRIKSFYPLTNIMLSPRRIVATIFSYWCIHLRANSNEILAPIQQPKSITHRDGLKPPIYPRRDVFKPHSLSTDANIYEISHCFAFVQVGSICHLQSMAPSPLVLIEVH